jgi:hypothetical protein
MKFRPGFRSMLSVRYRKRIVTMIRALCAAIKLGVRRLNCLLVSGRARGNETSRRVRAGVKINF